MPTEKEKVEARERSEAEKRGALAGATAVADGIKRLADAAVQEVQKASVGPSLEMKVTGTPGGGFVILGHGFGASGTVKIGGHQAKTFGWSSTRIEGKLPANVASGEVIVYVDDKTTRHGYFKAVPVLV